METTAEKDHFRQRLTDYKVPEESLERKIPEKGYCERDGSIRKAAEKKEVLVIERG